MENFNNQEQSGYEEIVSYGPKWLNEYREMNAVYKFAGWTLDLMAYWLEKIINNQFPAHADEITIVMFEKLLGIESETTASLDERRRLILAYYSGSVKLSKSEIQVFIKTYTDCDSEIWWEGTKLRIRIHCDEGYTFSNSKIYLFLKRLMPAHLAYLISDMLCRFKTLEIIENKIIHRTTISLFENILDGKGLLNGKNILDAMYPIFFNFKYIYIFKKDMLINYEKIFWKIETIYSEKMMSFLTYQLLFSWLPKSLDGQNYIIINKVYMSLLEKFEHSTMSFLSIMKNNQKAQIRERNKIKCVWYEGNLLDGINSFNGSEFLNQNMPPRINVKNNFEIINNENMIVTIYNPAKALNLNGKYVFDGKAKLNYGREKL